MDEMNNAPNNVLGDRKGTSNTTLAVLVIVALLVTIITTWTVLNASSTNVTNTNIAKQNVVQRDNGKVSLNILAPTHKAPSTGIGMVVLNVEKT